MSPALVVGVWLALAGAGPSVDGEPPAVVDLNTADVAALCTLPGIGPKKAVGIVSLRERRPLTRVSQLLQVRGIGPRLLERLKGRVTLRPPLSSGPAADRTRMVGFQQDAQRARGTVIAP